MTVPTWRARDVRREIDVVEEIVRFELEDVPPTLPERTVMFGRLTHDQRLRRVVEDVLVGAGFSEAYTYSLQAEDPDPNALELPEPLSAFQRVLRTTLLYGLVGAAGHNVDVGNEDIALFEIAHVYLPSGGERPDEPWRVGGIVEGGYLAREGRRRAALRDARARAPLRARAASVHADPGLGALGPGRLGRPARPAAARRRVGCVRARPRRAVRARRPSASCTRT